MYYTKKTPYYFLLPAFIVFAIFVLVPVLGVLWMSLFSWSSPSADPIFCWFANFAKLIHDPIFWSALWHNLLLVIMSLCLQLPLAMLLAVMLSYRSRLQTLFRTAFFAPMVMPTVAAAILWIFVFNSEEGLLNLLIQKITPLPGYSFAWLAESSTTLFCVFLVITWKYIGFHMVIFMAGISALPKSCFEAARVAGASERQIFWHLTLPMLKPIIAISATLSLIGSLKYFDLVYMMAEGAPQNSRELLATYLYKQAFDGNGRFGYGAAIATVMFLFALLLGSFSQLRRRRDV